MAKSEPLLHIFYEHLISLDTWSVDGSFRYFLAKAILRYGIYMIPFFVGEFLHFRKIHSEHTPFLHLIGSYAAHVSVITCYTVVTIFMLSHNTLPKLLEIHNDFEVFPKPKDMDGKNKFVSKIYTYYKWFLRVTLTTAMILKYVTKSQCERDYQEKGINDICGLFLELEFPFAIDYYPVLEIVAIYEFTIFVPCIEGAAAVVCSLFATVELINVRLDDLKDMFYETRFIENHIERRRHLGRCVAYHGHINVIFDHLCANYDKVLTFGMTLVGIDIGINSLYFLLEKDIQGLFLAISFLSVTSAGNYNGQGLIDKSGDLGTEVYNLPWYDYDKATAKDLLLIIIRGQKPLRFIAWPFHVFSADNLKQVVCSAYSCICVLYGILGDN